MHAPAEIRVHRIGYGPWPRAAPLIAEIDTQSRLLVATLDITWDEECPVDALLSLEDDLLAFSPSFGRHGCRGATTDHVLVRGRSTKLEVCRPCPTERFDGGLALAHLIEHLLIDLECEIGGMQRCSGATGAWESRRGRYDVIVECPDYRVGRCSLILALAWISRGLAGSPPGEIERRILTVARMARSAPEGSLRVRGVAANLGWTREEASQALSALSEAGYLESPRCEIDLPGGGEFRLTTP